MGALRNVARERDEVEIGMRRFLCGRYWLPPTDYPLCADVFSALGLVGSDCHDFMEGFSVTFNVDLADYVWPNYHLSESEAQDVRSVLRPLMRLAGLTTRPLDRDLIPISIDHLLQVARSGRWSDPQGGNAEGETRLSVSRSFTRFSARLRAGGVPRTHSR